ncbi:sigma-70 family RNA polymerase sigma factor [Flavivirga abyssicola]|uniref:RNA polymerase sigma factor n=1 Tax=Flavivirga abyssicola TaxID=3063533 RepID=UPI0026E0E889|nr:sigma-70 family RNA polymerase sigma factor [Flavivirga sp. MEBiC07777]WVK14752.1 sigma-70 family RNA polymerase sigma factor [Flavivirga sp. MEBiC07777]
MTDFRDNNSLLVKRLRLGDKDAYTQIYKIYYAKLCRYVYSLSNNASLAEDIVQEQLMHLWLKRETHTIISLNAYLYRSVYNKYISFCNAEKRQLSLKEKLRMEAIIEVESSEGAVNQERLNALKNIIDNLPQKRKEIFILSKLKNYEYKEIASMKNISERTVESQIRKALITIRHEVSQLKLFKNLSFFFFINPFF